jgi:molecular chaperone DnaK
MPAVQQQIREMFGKEPSKRVHPDEVVAAGAAIAAYSHNRTNAAVLHDMLPMPIGTASGDGQFRPIAARNTVLPADITFRVRAQPTGVPLKLPLFQGDGSHVFDNEMLGAIVLEEASDAREPVERDITLRLDAEGLLTVYANAPGDRQAKKVDLLGNQNPTELVTQMVQAKTEIVLPEPGSTASPAARARKRAAPQAKKPAPASTAPRRGSAKKDAAPAKGGWWQRLIGLFRG